MNSQQNKHCTSAILRLKSNPFATRYVAPGCLAWIGDEHETLDTIGLKFLRDHAGRAAIVGPHGSGKSTLLAHLVPRIGSIRYRESPTEHPAQTNDFGDILWLQLRREMKPVTQLARARTHWGRNRLLVLDGFEQLGRLRQWWVIAATRLSRMGLLVTSHAPVALPTLVTTWIDAPKAKAIVESAWQVHTPAALDYSLLPQLLERHQGNMREIFMELYDQVEG